MGGEDTGERSAAICTIIVSAKCHNHEPAAHLKDVLEGPLRVKAGN